MVFLKYFLRLCYLCKHYNMLRVCIIFFSFLWYCWLHTSHSIYLPFYSHLCCIFEQFWWEKTLSDSALLYFRVSLKYYIKRVDGINAAIPLLPNTLTVGTKTFALEKYVTNLNVLKKGAFSNGLFAPAISLNRVSSCDKRISIFNRNFTLKNRQ